MNLKDVLESSKNTKLAAKDHVKGGVPLYASQFHYQSKAYFETIKHVRKMIAEGEHELGWDSLDMLDTELGETVKVKGVGEVYLDSPYVIEGIKPIPGLLRSIALALGVTAGVMNLPGFDAQDTPLGQAMQQAAEEGDQIAKKHLPNLNFYSDEDPAMLAKLSNKYLHSNVNESIEIVEETPDQYYVYTRNPANGKVRKITFEAADIPAANATNKLTKEYWAARFHRYF